YPSGRDARRRPVSAADMDPGLRRDDNNRGRTVVAFQVAWRILTHQKGRTALAASGIFIAILLIFVELGFFIAVPQGGMLIYDHMRFDLLLTSDKYLFQAEAGQFPRARLETAKAFPEVAQASPLWLGGAK